MIKEETIETKHGNGVYYSTMIDGEKYVSRIVITDFCRTPELLDKWKTRAKEEVIRLLESKNK